MSVRTDRIQNTKHKVCVGCRRSLRARKIPLRSASLWACRDCGALCCEHLCLAKVGKAATCGTCNFNTRFNLATDRG